ncbi:MAG: ribbon-helix-helix domain-containing protein [Pleurocapsa sp. MO_226.B13]|nr:ribbon-helix-helix domain-containing protein [Pleurocapsa sp. MO_226.B13]
MHKKIAITIDEQLLAELDALVAAGVYPNRSQAISLALEEKRNFLRQKRFEIECNKLDPQEEREFAEWGGFEDWTEKY